MKLCKRTQTLRDAPNHEFMVQWGGSGPFIAKNSDAISWHELVHKLHQLNPFCTEFRVVTKHCQMHPNTTRRTKTCVRCDFVEKTFALIAPVQPVLHQALCNNVTIQNAPKHYETQQYLSLGSNGVGRLHSLRKIPKRLHGTNFCINCTSSANFAPSLLP